jgi:hypothetical protein
MGTFGRESADGHIHVRPGDCVPALIYKSFPVAGVEDSGGDVEVVGKCSDGEVDYDGDIVSPSWMAQAVKSWLATYPAVRLQHRPDYPAGTGLSAWQDDQGATLRGIKTRAERLAAERSATPPP